jgi:DNA-binding NarL/FixJ family response regulator
MKRAAAMSIVHGMTDRPTTSVVVAAERSATRSSLWTLLETEPGLRPVGTAADLSAAIRQLQALRPDVLLVHRTVLGEAGLRRLPMLTSEFPDVAIVVVGMGDHPELDAQVRRAGGAGYLRLDEAAERVAGVLGVSGRSSRVA